MKLTEIEQAICKKYSEPKPTKVKIDDEWVTLDKVSCNECPLVISRVDHLCKANASKRDLENYL